MLAALSYFLKLTPREVARPAVLFVSRLELWEHRSLDEHGSLVECCEEVKKDELKPNTLRSDYEPVLTLS